RLLDGGKFPAPVQSLSVDGLRDRAAVLTGQRDRHQQVLRLIVQHHQPRPAVPHLLKRTVVPRQPIGCRQGHVPPPFARRLVLPCPGGDGRASIPSRRGKR